MERGSKRRMNDYVPDQLARGEGRRYRPSCDGGGGGRGREWHGEHGGVEFCSATILLLAPRSASVDPHTSADAASPSPLATSTPSAPAYISKAGGYEKEDKAARAYDPGALKYWGANATTKALTSLKTATSERPRRCKT